MLFDNRIQNLFPFPWKLFIQCVFSAFDFFLSFFNQFSIIEMFQFVDDMSGWFIGARAKTWTLWKVYNVGEKFKLSLLSVSLDYLIGVWGCWRKSSCHACFWFECLICFLSLSCFLSWPSPCFQLIFWQWFGGSFFYWSTFSMLWANSRLQRSSFISLWSVTSKSSFLLIECNALTSSSVFWPGGTFQHL